MTRAVGRYRNGADGRVDLKPAGGTKYARAVRAQADAERQTRATFDALCQPRVDVKDESAPNETGAAPETTADGTAVSSSGTEPAAEEAGAEVGSGDTDVRSSDSNVNSGTSPSAENELANTGATSEGLHPWHSHSLARTPNNTNNWSCDGRANKGGCQGTGGGRNQVRYRCQSGCDYDLCQVIRVCAHRSIMHFF